MNDTFNLKRFSLLLKKTVLERPAQIIGLTVIVLCFTFIAYTAFLYFAGWNPAQNLSFIWGFVGGGVLLGSVVFGYFNTNASGSAYLTLPASTLEKWLCAVLIAGVFYCAIFLGFYRLLDTFYVASYHNGLNRNSPQYRYMYDLVQPFNFEGNIYSTCCMMFINFTGAMLVGSLYFNKMAVVKVALTVCAILGVIYLLNLCVAHIFFNNIDQANPYYNIFIKVGDDMGSVELPASAMKISDTVFYYILPAVLWITAYIRLKEKEI